MVSGAAFRRHLAAASLDKRLWYQVPPCGGIWRQRPEDRLLYTQTRNGPGLPPIGGSRPSPFFASGMTDVRKGFRMNLYHALIADGGRYVGVASFHSPPTHCRKTKGGAGVRTRTFTGISQVSFAYAKAPGPVCPLVPERASGGEGMLVQLAPVWN